MAFESTLKYSFTPKELADKKAKERKVNLLLLIQHFLKSEGYVESYYQLLNEAKLPKDYEICDNMELNNILQDYETFYYIRFQKYPKISKKVPVTNDGCEKKNISKTTTLRKQPTLKEKEKSKKESSDVSITGMAVLPLSPECCEMIHHDDRPDDKLFKPLGCFEGYSDEWKTLADIISREIVDKNLNVKWDDVIGLEEAKAVMKEAIVYPMKYPQLYKGNITPWKGLLMYGPSGTGKTLLAKAVASECKTTFFNISASSIVSKWRGDSEKLVRVMFDLARLQAPSTIFVDELDAIASQRDSTHEHEASRRLKSELLVQLDGLCESNENIFFLTTSNLPWDLDVAILRRLEKKVLIGLPELDARQKLIQMYLPAVVMTDPLLTVNIDYKLFAQECHGYSGSDIKLLCKEVTMGALRQVFSDLESNKRTIGNNMSRPKLKPISDEDFSCALKKIKATTATSIERYLKWALEFGSI